MSNTVFNPFDGNRLAGKIRNEMVSRQSANSYTNSCMGIIGSVDDEFTEKCKEMLENLGFKDESKGVE
jgi:hypothetical protein